MSAEIPSYEIEADTDGNGISRVTCKSASPLSVDTSAGQSPERFGPAELLAAAFAACMLKNVERFSHTLSFRYRGARMQVTAEREGRPPRIVRLRYVLRLSTDEPAVRIDLLRRNLLRFGTVSMTLARSCEITGEIETEATSVRLDRGVPAGDDRATPTDRPESSRAPSTPQTPAVDPRR